mmetsp:Transcript_111068/g.313284  ORF Transcript_111068/g.313284 Transcript_111068/m.313284 type:complete len:289 (-) Transcript_111068:637-1503(-)
MAPAALAVAEGESAMIRIIRSSSSTDCGTRTLQATTGPPFHWSCHQWGASPRFPGVKRRSPYMSCLKTQWQHSLTRRSCLRVARPHLEGAVHGLFAAADVVSTRCARRCIMPIPSHAPSKCSTRALTQAPDRAQSTSAASRIRQSCMVRRTRRNVPTIQPWTPSPPAPRLRRAESAKAAKMRACCCGTSCLALLETRVARRARIATRFSTKPWERRSRSRSSIGCGRRWTTMTLGAQTLASLGVSWKSSYVSAFQTMGTSLMPPTRRRKRLRCGLRPCLIGLMLVATP